MPIEGSIVDPRNGYGARVSPEGTLGVVVHPHPPTADDATPILPYRAFFQTSAGSSDLQVAASLASPSRFTIDASTTRDRFIRSIAITIADATSALNKFGNVTALANGCQLLWESGELGTVTIGDSLTSNFEFVRLCQGNPAFGDGASAFIAGNVSGTSEGLLCVLDFQRVFGLVYGVRLRKGSNDRLVIVVRDDTTGVDQFDALAYGFEV